MHEALTSSQRVNFLQFRLFRPQYELNRSTVSSLVPTVGCSRRQLANKRSQNWRPEAS